MKGELERLRREVEELKGFKTKYPQLEEALQQKEAWFFKIFHASSNPMSITAIKGSRIIDVNEAYIRLSGFGREELVGHAVDDLPLLADRKHYELIAHKIREEGRVPSFELEVLTKTGQSLILLFSADFITVNGEPCMLTVAIDITAHTREANALRRSEEKYRQLVENSLQGLNIIQDGRFVFCNARFAEMIGYSTEEVLSLSPNELEGRMYPDDQVLLKRRREARDAGEPVSPSYEFRGIKKDGTGVWMEAYSSPIEYNGKPALQTALIDITERKLAEAAAIESRERLLLAHQAAGMASWDLNNQTGEVIDDEHWLPSLGYQPHEIESNLRSLEALQHPDDLGEVKRAASDHLEGKAEFYSVEYRIRNKAGSWVWVLDRGKLVSRDSAGRPLRTIGVHFNITEHKHAMEQIRQLANEQKAILNSISMGICYTKKRKLQWVNPTFANMFGYEIGELWGLDTSIFYSNLEDYERVGIDGYARLAEGLIYSTEAFMRKGDGSLIWCSIVGQAINPQNLEEGSIWELHDITEHKQADDKLRRALDWHNAIFEGSRDAILINDSNSMIVDVNPAAVGLTGYSKEELLKMRGADLNGETDLRGFEMLRRQILSGEDILAETTIKTKDGRKMDVEFGHRRVIIDGVAYIHTIARDVTARKKLEAQFLQAQKMEAVGLLAGGVAHDFNNLLTVIKGYAEIMMEGLNPQDAKHGDLEQIIKAGDQAASLTSQLLAFSRKQMLKPEILDLNATIAQMSSMLRRLIGEDIEFVTIPYSDLGFINADPGQIQQIIMNLAVNARDAMQQGGKLTIEAANIDIDEAYVREHPQTKAGSYVMLAISDNGIGMDAGTQARLFEPFYTTKDRGKGTGLGLATVYGIVKQSEGFIWVYSEPQKGTTFKVYFPRVEGQVKEIRVEGRVEHRLRGYETVLLVEDEPSLRALASRILRERGYSVFEASNGNEALDITQKHVGKIHLVVTDVVMPEMGGRALVSQLKVTRPGIKTLFVSGYTDNAIVHHGILDSDVNFLQKPFTVGSLLSKVREVLDS